MDVCGWIFKNNLKNKEIHCAKNKTLKDDEIKNSKEFSSERIKN